jgi:hypothetical protein
MQQIGPLERTGCVTKGQIEQVENWQRVHNVKLNRRLKINLKEGAGGHNHGFGSLKTKETCLTSNNSSKKKL